MKTGVACLVLGYVLSQFYRAFLAVLAPVLTAELGATADQLSLASGFWFLAFAAMQIPVGWALDRLGPRRTASILLAIGGGGGALIFAQATDPVEVIAAMALIGVGCSPVLMAGYFIFARVYPPAVFGTLAGVMIGVGSLGNIGAALPLTLAVEAFGWRGTLAGLGAATIVIALLVWRFVQDPPRVERRPGEGSLLDVLRMPAFWLIVPMMFVNYAPSGSIRGLWAGPYLDQVFGATAAEVGFATLAMGLAMVAGSFAYGPLDRVFGTRKGVVLAGNLACVACLAALWAMPASGYGAAVALIAAAGFFGTSFPMIMAHGRAFFPAHLTGRGVTLLNLFGIGGVGVLQVVSGRVHAAAGPDPVTAHAAVFGFFALVLGIGCAIYAFSRDRTD